MQDRVFRHERAQCLAHEELVVGGRDELLGRVDRAASMRWSMNSSAPIQAFR